MKTTPTKTTPADDPDLTTEMAEALIEIGDNTVTRWLEKHPAEATRIAKLPKSKQAAAIYDLDERLRGAREKPAKPKAESMETYAKRRNAELAKKRTHAGISRRVVGAPR